MPDNLYLTEKVHQYQLEETLKTASHMRLVNEALGSQRQDACDSPAYKPLPWSRRMLGYLRMFL